MALVATKLIVLSSIKYSDTSLIVRCYTASDGLRSYFLKGVLARKKGKLKKAHFQPLMQLEVVASHSDKDSLDFIREVKIDYAYKTLYTDVYKQTLVYFISEFLTNALREEIYNEGLYDYLALNLQRLDHLAHYTNFHFVFLLNLSQFLGFYPDTKNRAYPYFNLEHGVFENRMNSDNCLVNKELLVFKKLLGINFDTLNTVQFSTGEKQLLITVLIRYFTVHLTAFKKLKSVAILHEVLHT